MKVFYETGLSRCKLCGSKPRYRYRVPFHWIECQNKKCRHRTRYYKDMAERFDQGSRKLACDEWNAEKCQL